MLVLKREEGQWTEFVHRSGDVIRFRIYGFEAREGRPKSARVAFDDDARNFEIQRPERRLREARRRAEDRATAAEPESTPALG